jgi:hypothetical protein
MARIIFQRIQEPSGRINMNISEEEIQVWKDEYLNKGLPIGLLEAMIEEANAEWNSSIGIGDLSRLANLAINITDNEETKDCSFLTLILDQSNVIRGRISDSETQLFIDVSCIDLDVIVIKYSLSSYTIVGIGKGEISHSKNEELEIIVEGYSNTQITIAYTLNSPFQHGVIAEMLLSLDFIDEGDKTCQMTSELTFDLQ